MEKYLCTTCGEIVEGDDMFYWEELPICPNGHDHTVITLEEASDIINDYQRMRKELEKTI